MKKQIWLALPVCLIGALASCGNSGFDANRNISVTVREDGSGTKSAFLEIVGLKGNADPEGAILATGTTAVLQEVASNPYAIAYESLGYVDDSVKMLTVDGAASTVENIKSGAYKISRPLNVIYKDADVKASSLYTDYLGFLGSKDAQDIVTTEGYSSIVDGAKAYANATKLEGRIKISGSTSLQPLMIKIAAAYKTVQPNVVVEVSGGGSGTGYSDGENGVSAFGMISEEFKTEKAPSCTYYTVAKDGIAIIVNKENPLDDIAKTQLADIYNPEKTEASITRWSDIIK
ncbi:MAG: substrate-binding domain-containing protein [Candidatus Enteromonas sp.]